MPPVQLPAGFVAFAARDEGWARFVARLPGLIAELLAEWDLGVEGEPLHGQTALVLPVRTRDGQPAVLKTGFPDEESEHEHLALRAWAGRGAVRLLRADPARRALLLERLRPVVLSSLPMLAACEVVAGLYAQLHVPAPASLRTVPDSVARWCEALRTATYDVPLPRRLVAQCLSLAADLVGDEGSSGTLVHTDLHDDNVLAADRAAWLAIDPKCLSGDPHYEVAPMLWNRWEQARATGDVRRSVRERFAALVDAAGLDEDRARDWVVVRLVLNASWTLQDADRQRRGLSAQDRAWITRCVAVAKAVQE